MDLCMERKTVMKEIEGEIRIYPSRFYYMELNVARMLNDLDIDCAMPEDMMENDCEKWRSWNRFHWIQCNIRR